MTGAQPSIRYVIDRLVSEGYLDKDAPSVGSYLQRTRVVQPWYIRTMVGFGAWLSSLLLIGFVSSMGVAVDGGYTVLGLLFLGGAIYLRKVAANDFAVQCALAAGLAGQALIVIGIMQIMDWEEPKLGLGLVTMINLVLFVVFPDRIYRVLSALLAVGALVILVYLQEWNVLVPLFGPLLTAGLIAITFRGAKLLSGSKAIYLRPLQSGLMLSAFGCLMVSTVYVMPELGGSFQFYPRPWVSTILLGLMLLYALAVAWEQIFAGTTANARYLVFAVVVLIIASAWLAPGLVLSLIVLVLGAHTGHRSMIGAGVAFLAVFLGAYFYGIQLTMLQKSMTLVTAGIAVLFARWLLLRLLPVEVGRAAADVHGEQPQAAPHGLRARPGQPADIRQGGGGQGWQDGTVAIGAHRSAVPDPGRLHGAALCAGG